MFNDCHCSFHPLIVRTQKHLVELVFVGHDKGPRMALTICAEVSSFIAK